jgi:hypothetical protein
MAGEQGIGGTAQARRAPSLNNNSKRHCRFRGQKSFAALAAKTQSPLRGEKLAAW